MKKFILILACLPAGYLSAEAQTPSTSNAITMEKVSPNIYVRNIKQTVAFYKQLGFDVLTTVPDKGDPVLY
jgi:hypothetical protein